MLRRRRRWSTSRPRVFATFGQQVAEVVKRAIGRVSLDQADEELLLAAIRAEVDEILRPTSGEQW